MLLLSRLPQGQTYGGTNRRFPERSSDIAGRAKYLLTISVSREKKKGKKTVFPLSNISHVLLG